MPERFTPVQRAILIRLLSHLEGSNEKETEDNIQKIAVLIKHADTVDTAMTTANAFGRVGGVLKWTIAYTAGIIVGVAAISGHLKEWILAWLGR